MVEKTLLVLFFLVGAVYFIAEIRQPRSSDLDLGQLVQENRVIGEVVDTNNKLVPCIGLQVWFLGSSERFEPCLVLIMDHAGI